MLYRFFLLLLIAYPLALLGQEDNNLKIRKKLLWSKAILVDSTDFQLTSLQVFDATGTAIDTSLFYYNSASKLLHFSEKKSDSIEVVYLRYPTFLTKNYAIYEKSSIVSQDIGQTVVQMDKTMGKPFMPFDGLNTSGSITRGITVGNNQNAVVNSALDLQITGKLSDRVSLRASIQDTNIPLQEGGYSQKLDEFDQIFIELFSERWQVRAGDLFLENRQSRFLNFNKKVQGVSGGFTFGKQHQQTKIYTAAALVRGQYAKSTFTGQEGNQGPYKLRGPNDELYVLVISGSERVFVNGLLLTRGENNDYIIDYNAGEITFTSLFPITSEMRINVEYQYSDRNYTRFITYGGVTHENKKWQLGGYLYSENDIKNQPLQQTLTTEQAQILSLAGDNPAAMVAPSAFLDDYSANKILYKKVFINGVEAFEYSNDPSVPLFNVRFTLLGNNQGNYILANSAAIGKIYQYVAPINGILQGNYEPIIRLVAPTKIQIATITGAITPNEKTAIKFEGAVSNNDLNLFSPVDDGNNKAIAASVNATQRLLSRSRWKATTFAQFQFVQENFKTIERLFTIEFNRDWNLTTFSGDQALLVSGIQADFGAADSTSTKKGSFKYQVEQLTFSKSFQGFRQVVDIQTQSKSFGLRSNSSLLKSDSQISSSSFARNTNLAKYHFGKNFISATFNFEDNTEKNKATGLLTNLSQRFTAIGSSIGRGDTTKVYAELGYLKRRNDSLQNGFVSRVNSSTTYFIKSRLIQNEQTSLSAFINYRDLQFTQTGKNEPSLNSRIVYSDRYWSQFAALSASYETLSGTIAQQEFTYLEVAPGQGIYTWNDYNANGIQDLEEFEVAPFPDQAKYIRVFLPNQIFIKTHQNRFSTALTINPAQWQNKNGWKKWLSRFYNQTSFLLDRKVLRTQSNFNLNPFDNSTENLLGLNSAIRNSFYYNRGKQDHSMAYTYLINQSRSLLSVGLQESANESHQIQYTHLIKKSWLFNLAGRTIFVTLNSENFPQKNYRISGLQANPKLSYLFSKNTSFDLFYEYQTKSNKINLAEKLNQHRIGASFAYAGENTLTVNGELSMYQNRFQGDVLSPAAFQMLEGLVPGKNLTWRLLIQKNLTEYLDVNLNYQGRKSETGKAIQTGSIQLRAFF